MSQSDPPSTFETIHRVGMIFGTYDKLLLLIKQNHVVFNSFPWQPELFVSKVEGGRV